MANAIRLNFGISGELTNYILSQPGVTGIIEEGTNVKVFTTTLTTTQINQLKQDIAQNHLAEVITV